MPLLQTPPTRIPTLRSPAQSLTCGLNTENETTKPPKHLVNHQELQLQLARSPVSLGLRAAPAAGRSAAAGSTAPAASPRLASTRRSTPPPPPGSPTQPKHARPPSGMWRDAAKLRRTPRGGGGDVTWFGFGTSGSGPQEGFISASARS